jgi:integrase
MTRIPFLQIVRGKYRVRVVVPPALIPHLPPPHTGLGSLTKSLGVYANGPASEREAGRLAIPHIAEFHTALAEAAQAIENPDLADWIARYAHHHPGVSWKAPEWPPSPPAVKVVPFETVIPFWARYSSAPKKGIAEMEAKCSRFAEALGHDNMEAVTFPDCRDYRDALIAEGELSSGSILNHLKLLKSLFKYGYDNELITNNHMSRIKYQAGDRLERDDFTPEERRLILTLARTAPLHLYWCNWLCSFHGFRTSEVADASTRDIECVDGIWIIKIHRKHRTKDQGLKTGVSTRSLALHQAVLDEGFLEYWNGLPEGSPLFPGKLDPYGKRAGYVSSECSLWLRGVVKITDPAKPFYSHRHTATSFLRNTRLPDGSPAVKEDIERYILGHAGKGWHAGYGKHWYETLKSAVEVIPNPLV